MFDSPLDLVEGNPNADQSGPKDRMAEGVADQNTTKCLSCGKAWQGDKDHECNPAPSSLEEELESILSELGNANYQAGKKYGFASENLRIKAKSEALSQLKQLILKDVLEMASEDFVFGESSQAFDEGRKYEQFRISQSARKRYQS